MPDSSDAAAVCPRCGGRGWLVESDGRAGSARRCDCRRQQAVPRLLEAAGIPPLYRRCTLDNFNTSASKAGVRDQLVGAQSLCRQYVDGFLGADGRFSATGLLFVGPPGVGKTHLAVAVASELVRRYRAQARFVDFTSLIHRIQSTFDPSSEASKHQVLDPVMKAEVLVLDELGAQKPTDWVRDTLYLILNTRYTEQLATLFTTNLLVRSESPATSGLAGPPAATSTGYSEIVSRSQREREVARRSEGDVQSARPPRRRELLEWRIGSGLLSRLYEMARIVEIQAGDFRREVKMAQHVG